MKDGALSSSDAATGGWDGILDPGEHVLWQDRPVPGLTFAGAQPMVIAVGLIFIAFSLFWMAMVTSMIGTTLGVIALFPLFGLPFLLIGLWTGGGSLLWAAWLRRYTTYTLTNRRAMIASDLPYLGRRLQSWPIDATSRIDLDDGDPGNVWFSRRHYSSRNAAHFKPIGFLRVTNPRRVYSILRNIGTGAT